MNKFLKTILIVLVICVVGYLILTFIGANMRMNTINEANKNANISYIKNYISEANNCLALKGINKEKVPTVVTDINYCGSPKAGIESIELYTYINSNNYYQISIGTIVYDGVTYEYDGTNVTVK